MSIALIIIHTSLSPPSPPVPTSPSQIYNFYSYYCFIHTHTHAYTPLLNPFSVTPMNMTTWDWMTYLGAGLQRKWVLSTAIDCI